MAYELRIRDWSSDVCSSDLAAADRVDGPRKVSGKAPYAYERHDMVPDPAYGVILGSAIAKGRIISIDSRDAESAHGVLAIVTADNAGKIGRSAERRVGKACGSTCKYRWSPDP